MNTTCAHCGTPLRIKPSSVKPGGNYCSKACWYASGAARPQRKTGAERVCEVCGTVFYAQHNRLDTAKYCSRKCKGVASRLAEKPCAVCGKMFRPPMGRADQPCCSKKCGHIYRRKRDDRPCEVCGKMFSPYGDQARFCSWECTNVWQGRHKTEHVCKMCGKTFRWSPSRGKAYNVTYCSLACRDADPDRHAMLVAMNAMQQRMKPNHVEQTGYAILDSLGVAYTPQHVIGGKFCVDAFLPDSGVIVQFDGDYWHGNPAKFPAPDARQRRRMTLDVSQDAYMVKCGYTVIRVWASDLERRGDHVTAELRRLLIQPGHAPAVHRLSLAVV